ncbi:AAA family ATPase [Candidatus Woesearchaeota archaeon]|nr:AAA family ATPase [Candidatus Woesearchaeota archaeon]
MRIYSLEIENFRQYRNKQEIKFSTDPHKNFTIFEGANGTGKSNLLRSVMWCLYGKEDDVLSNYDEENKVGIVNEQLLRELAPGERTVVRVRINMGNENPEYIIERTSTYRKRDNGFLEKIDEKFVIMEATEQGFKPAINPTTRVKAILPNEIKGYFFFDGEKLDEFFKPGRGTKVKKAVFDVSQIELLQRTIKHLESVNYKLVKGQENLSPKIKSLQEDLESAEDRLRELQTDEDDYGKRILEANEDIEKINKFLSSYSDVNVKELQSRRDELDQDIKSLSEEMKVCLDEKNELMLEHGSTILIHGAVCELMKQIDELEEKNVIPPNIDPSFVRKLISEQECLCGREIKRGTNEFELLNKIAQHEEYGEYSKLLMEGRSELRFGIDGLSSFEGKLRKLSERLILLEKRKHEALKRISEISIALKDIDLESISSKESQRESLMKALQSENGSLAVCKNNISDLNTQIKEWTKDLGALLGKESENKDLLDKVNILNGSITLLKEILEDMIEDVRMTIQKKTQDYFLSLIWKKETYKEVKIDENYNVSVLNRFGKDSLDTLSAGERQVLALSFMAALNEVSGFDAPVIIDTPLGRISGEPKDNIAECLPNYLKNTQVTLLVTDQEYTHSVKSKISKRIGKEFKLLYNDASCETKVTI